MLRSHRWRTAANSAAYLTPHLRAGLRLLDVGCGPGTLTCDMAAAVAPGRVLGVDTSEEVIEQARAHAVGIDGVPPGALSFLVGDFRDPAVAAAGPFDVVHAHQVLQHLQDPVGALRAMADLLEPGGLVAARDVDYASMHWAPHDERLDQWLAIIREVSQRNGGHPDAGRHLRRWARAAGLTDATYTTSTWTFAAPEERRWWAEMWAERTVASSVAEQAEAYGIATAAQLQEVAEGWRTWASQVDAVFTAVHGEILSVR